MINHIYIWKDEQQISDALLNNYPFPNYRRNRINNYQKQNKRNAQFSYLLLCYALGKQTIKQSSGEWVYGINGKPYLKEFPHIFFNISHSGCYSACALSSAEIGIDVQLKKQTQRSLWDKVCSTSEVNNIIKASQPCDTFIRYWTLKESEIKQQGGTICSDLSVLDFSDIEKRQKFFKRGKYFTSFSNYEAIISVCSMLGYVTIHTVSYQNWLDFLHFSE